MDQSLVRLSKTISHALRHAPDQYGITLDPEGWCGLAELLAAIRATGRFRSVTRERVNEILAASDKQRFELADGRIRAYYGHSVQAAIRRRIETPPKRLYHGTSRDAMRSIWRYGLKPMGRQYVHLAADMATALRVGSRHDCRPVLLEIDTSAALETGVTFSLGNETIWLADPLPPECLVEVVLGRRVSTDENG